VNASIWFPFKFPNFNELIADASKVRQKRRRSPLEKKQVVPAYAETKRRWTSIVVAWCRQKGYAVLPGCWEFTYLFVEENMRKDPLNIAAGAVKMIEDGLVKAGVMENDGWAQVSSLHCYFASTKDKETHGLGKAGVLLSIGPKMSTEAEMLEVARMLSKDVPRSRSQKTTIQALEASDGAPDHLSPPEGDGPTEPVSEEASL
jgi:hypothetical protein